MFQVLYFGFFSFIDRFTLSCIFCLYVSQVVFEFCKILSITDVTNVAVIGEWSEFN